MSSEPSSKKEAVQSVIKALVDAVYVAKSKGENINPGVEALKQEVFEQVAQ
ncbi:MAG: hypothetical protein K0Q74_1236, partial [Gammaproteobacteria bacterium]|nr:hypothetical protein [Gammaproteobacteria bacterium]